MAPLQRFAHRGAFLPGHRNCIRRLHQATGIFAPRQSADTIPIRRSVFFCDSRVGMARRGFFAKESDMATATTKASKAKGSDTKSTAAPKIRQTKLLIDGKWVNSASGKTFETINPATGEVIAQ